MSILYGLISHPPIVCVFLLLLTCLQKRTLMQGEFLQREIERNWSAQRLVAVTYVCGMN